jgi:hypothetical protein
MMGPYRNPGDFAATLIGNNHRILFPTVIFGKFLGNNGRIGFGSFEAREMLRDMFVNVFVSDM